MKSNTTEAGRQDREYITLSNAILTYNDEDYSKAVNFDGTNYYNAPITLNWYGTKYIIPCGTQDSISLLRSDNTIYVIGENTGLTYISLTEIDIEAKEIRGKVYLHGDDIENTEAFSYGILEKDTEEQLTILQEYIGL